VNPLLDVRGLRFVYGDGREALRGVDLAVGEGELIGIVGRNGSGKSTLARVLAGLERPGGADRVDVCGHDLADDGERRTARRSVGILFQDPESQVVGATVEEDVAFGLENLGLPAEDIAMRVEEMLGRFDLVRFRNREPHLLSGGQKQRTALAGVMAVPRRVMVLDEPTAMLDADGRRDVLAATRRLRGDGLTVIAVTQEMDELPDADRVVALDDGTVAFDGSARDLFADGEAIERLGLGLPIAAEVALELRRRGAPLPRLPLSVAELVSALPSQCTGAFAAPSGASGSDVDMPAHNVDMPAPDGDATTPDTESGRVDERADGAGRGTPDIGRPDAHTAAGGVDGAARLADAASALSLRCEGVGFSYDETAGRNAVRDVTFELRPGTATALLGPSGAGKSTLLLLLKGLLRADSGAVTIGGVGPEDDGYRNALRQVGLVFQRPETQLFAATAVDDVAFGPRQLGWPEDEVRSAVDDALAAVGLPAEEFGDRHPYSLSGGEQRRLALAGVLAMRPGVLLLDEPFVSLDPAGRRDLMAILRRLTESGVTLLLATHAVDPAWELCDERLVIDRGTLVSAGRWRGEGWTALAAARLPEPELVALWRALGRPADGAPRSPAAAAAILAGEQTRG